MLLNLTNNNGVVICNFGLTICLKIAWSFEVWHCKTDLISFLFTNEKVFIQIQNIVLLLTQNKLQLSSLANLSPYLNQQKKKK